MSTAKHAMSTINSKRRTIIQIWGIKLVKKPIHLKSSYFYCWNLGAVGSVCSEAKSFLTGDERSTS